MTCGRKDAHRALVETGAKSLDDVVDFFRPDTRSRGWNRRRRAPSLHENNEFDLARPHRPYYVEDEAA